MKKILLIEDNLDIRENTAEILQLASYQVFIAENGKLGVEMAIKHLPDLIVCDIMMPVLDGYGVLHLIGKNEQLAAIPFIFLTAKTERGDLRKGMDLGADDYITKPFTETELLNSIEIRLKKAELMKKDFGAGDDGLQQFFSETSGFKELETLPKDRKSTIYKKKQVVYHEGDQPMKLFYLSKGKVKAYKTSPDGKEFITGLYASGDFFGYLPILEETGYQDTAEALEESELVSVPKEEFLDLLFKNRQVAHRFIKMLAGTVSEKEIQLISLAYNSLRKRVAQCLLSLMKKYSNNQEPFSMYISREDLANMVGTATESLIRTLSDFRSEKLLDIQDGKIQILNEKKLERMAN